MGHASPSPAAVVLHRLPQALRLQAPQWMACQDLQALRQMAQDCQGCTSLIIIVEVVSRTQHRALRILSLVQRLHHRLHSMIASWIAAGEVNLGLISTSALLEVSANTLMDGL